MGILPAKKRTKKQTKRIIKRSTSSRKKSPKTTKKTVKRTNSRIKKTTKPKIKKVVKRSSSAKKKSPKKTTKRVIKKTIKKKPAKNTRKTSTKTVKRITRQTKTNNSDDKFNLLLEELRSLRNNNAELSQQIIEIQNQQLKQQTNFQQRNEEPTYENNSQNNKEELISQIKKLLTKKNREELNKEPSDSITEQSINYKENNIDQLSSNNIGEKEVSTHFVTSSENNNFPQMDKTNKNFRVEQKDEQHNKYQEEYSINEDSVHKNNKNNFQETIINIKKEDFQANKKRGVITIEEAEEYSVKLKDLQREINKVFIGQEEVVENVIISLVCDAHTLLEGVPGLAKSLLIETFGKTISGTTFERIQFLPDLLPADIIGGQIFNPKTAEFITKKGPIFANFVLADEINRAPPKTHAAVMEAMQEKKINIENEEFILDRPFLVLATQNPLENKGTYQLPEAVLDRFMFKVILDYPKRSDEFKIITDNATTKKNLQKKIRMVLSKKEILEIQQKVKSVFISDKIREYILDLVEATRGINKNIQGVKFLKYGAGVRASIYLGIAAKARALLEGRNYVLPDDVYHEVPNIFRHRLSLNYKGKAHNISTDKIIEEILKKVNPI